LAFKILKLVNDELIIADVYSSDEIEKYLPETKQIGGLGILILLNPVLLIETVKEGNLLTTMEPFVKYTDDDIIPIDKDKILVQYFPSKKILTYYNKYVLQQKYQLDLESAQKKINESFNEDLTEEEMTAILEELEYDEKKPVN